MDYIEEIALMSREERIRTAAEIYWFYREVWADRPIDQDFKSDEEKLINTQAALHGVTADDIRQYDINGAREAQRNKLHIYAQSGHFPGACEGYYVG